MFICWSPYVFTMSCQVTSALHNHFGTEAYLSVCLHDQLHSGEGLWRILHWLFRLSPRDNTHHCYSHFIDQPNLASISSVQFISVAQLCPTLCNPMDCSTTSLTVHHHSQSLLKLMSIESVMPSSHLILYRPLLLLLPIPPSIRVFSNESTLHKRWPKYWSFNFNISPSSEHPGLISFRMD